MRYLSDILGRFTQDKFVLLSGPRQVGKTTKKGMYLNWDSPQDRETLLKNSLWNRYRAKLLFWMKSTNTLVGSHGLKDSMIQKAETLEVVVSGSARLDVYQRVEIVF